ncbi:Elongation factor Ts mitochondrial, partial [Dissostichus eleginoides]
CGLLSAEAFALTTGAVFAKRARATQRSPQGSTLSDTTRGFSLPAHCLHHHSSFPSVRNLYFISELWSSSAQLSADKAQEALERRHGYLDGKGGEGAGERKAGRQ